MHDTTVLLIELGAVLFALGLLGRLSRRIGLSPIPLYLLAGLAFGHGGVLPLSATEEFIAVGAEIGVILLLVMLGLEYSARELIGNLRTNAPAGLLDGVLNAVPGLAFGLLMGWGWVAALVLAGITWVSSSGVIAKVLADLGRLGNRETPVMLSILVIEDLAMALYLPLLTAVLAGAGLIAGAKALSIAVGTVVVVLVVALKFGHAISAFISARDPEALLLGVLGLTLLVAGLAAQLQVSAAVGAFLVGIALSGPVAHHATELLTPLRDLFAAVFFVFFGLATSPADMPPVLLPALGLAAITMGTKIITGYVAAKRAGIALPGRVRAGLGLMPRGEFSIVIAGLAVATPGIEPRLAPLATAYVLITVVTGPMLARLPDFAWFKRIIRRAQRPAHHPEPLPTTD
ncbi:cation:proton antiporter [Phytohabitans suffuscus]|uniref:Potassium transporter n=1 Tax=Phytohabitans suffuscus TaxID=624315 RepID=A0A6F8YIB6_9ACTN|nr:cation:proton antiporter [Phytohabitans suffuscus]BCB85807.1 potassium transporter [Phytohabitans suffuscus]